MSKPAPTPDVWSRVPASGIEVLRSTLESKAKDDSETDSARLIPDAQTLLANPKTRVYIARPHPSNTHYYVFAAYLRIGHARLWAGNFGSAGMKKIFDESKQVELLRIDNVDLREFLADPNRYHLTGARLDLLRKEFGRAIEETEALTLQARVQIQGAILSLAEVFGGTTPLSYKLRDNQSSPDYVYRALKRDLEPLLRVSRDLAAMLEKM